MKLNLVSSFILYHEEFLTSLRSFLQLNDNKPERRLNFPKSREILFIVLYVSSLRYYSHFGITRKWLLWIRCLLVMYKNMFNKLQDFCLVNYLKILKKIAKYYFDSFGIDILNIYRYLTINNISRVSNQIWQGISVIFGNFGKCNLPSRCWMEIILF